MIANDIIFLDRRQEVSEDGPELDEELATPPFPGRPAAQPGEPRRFAPGIMPRQRPQSVSPPATQDEGDDELPF